MGFKCPVCMKDFGRNKSEWESHCKTCLFGSAWELVEFVRKTAEETKEEKDLEDLIKEEEETE